MVMWGFVGLCTPLLVTNGEPLCDAYTTYLPLVVPKLTSRAEKNSCGEKKVVPKKKKSCGQKNYMPQKKVLPKKNSRAKKKTR